MYNNLNLFHLLTAAIVCKELIMHVQDLLVERCDSGQGYNTFRTHADQWRQISKENEAHGGIAKNRHFL